MTLPSGAARRGGFLAAVAVLAGVMLAASGAFGQVMVRRPAAAGEYYPEDPVTLAEGIKGGIDETEAVLAPGRVSACVLPSWKHEHCMRIAAPALKNLEPGGYGRVIILAPPSNVRLEGCSIPVVRSYVTPLGEVPLDTEAVGHIMRCPHIRIRRLFYRESAFNDARVGRLPMHEREHAIEVILPYLQVRLGSFKLVPILMGDLKKRDGSFHERALEELVRSLSKIVDDRTLIIVSTSFTKYGPEYGFTPFDDDVQGNITALDLRAFQLLSRRDEKGFLAYLDETKNPIPGKLALLCLLRLTAPGTRGVMLEYDTTGRLNNDYTRSVSFASLVFYRPGSPQP